MTSMTSPLPLKGYRFPRSVIAYAVWAYHRFAMSLRDVEDLLAARGVTISYETVRAWVNRFGPQMAAQIRRDRPQASDKWHIDEVVITIRGEQHWLRRAVDSRGDVLEILVQSRRNARAAKRFLRKLMRNWGVPRVVVTDKLRSYDVALREDCPVPITVPIRG
jgi:putative transposase